MLFVWDLHFKNDKKYEIFQKLEEKINQIKPKNIIFLWDYIYHFAYDPKLIWEFFDFCLKLSQNWTKVFIIAGNHDYIKGHFIFHEVEKILKFYNTNLKIISSPQNINIDQQNILFFPFFSQIIDEEKANNIKNLLSECNLKEKNILDEIFQQAIYCLQQEDKNTKISWSINLLLIENYIKFKPDILVHHFYIADTIFTGQLSKFSFKNIALSNKVFDLPIKIISGHLHKPFVYKNYICIGSFWNTSPLEENDTKVIFEYPDKFYQIVINPYISINEEQYEEINENTITNIFSQVIDETEKNLKSKIIKDNFNLKQFNLIIKTLNYNETEKKLSKNLIENINKITYKWKIKEVDKIIENLNIDTEKLKTSFSSWKELAEKYIKEKYPENYQEYLSELQNLNL